MTELKENEIGAKMVYGKDCPYIEIQRHEDGLFVSEAVLRLIGNPDTIRIQWNASKRILIIESSDASDANGLLVADFTDTGQGVLFIGSFILFNEIWNSKWDDDMCYRIVAKYNVPSNLAIFDIGKAVASDSYIDYNLD